MSSSSDTLARTDGSHSGVPGEDADSISDVHGAAPGLAALGRVQTVALVGNPNSGKTTVFNALTGLRYKVGNYPGVTVEKKAGLLRNSDGAPLSIVDLPGIYSLAGSSDDERIATAVVLGKMRGEALPELIVAVVDASNLERNLYLISQLIDCGLPLILALNMADLAEERGIMIHKELLARGLDVPIVSLVAKEGKGIEELKRTIRNAIGSGRSSAKRLAWATNAPHFVDAIEKLGAGARESGHHQQARFDAVVGCNLITESIDLPGHYDATRQATEALRKDGLDPASFEASARYQWLNDISRKCCTIDPARKSRRSELLDKVLLHRFWGVVVFLGLMTLVFQSIFLWAEGPMGSIEGAIAWLSDSIKGLLPEGALRSLLVDGVVAGVGNVLVFVPQIAILFFCLGALEDSGYLSRAAFVMDRVMRPVGLQGRSFIPLLSSFACAIPGIMATRTIPSRGDRLVTIMVAPLMSCSARLPVYTVMIGAFIPATLVAGGFSLQGLVLLGLYMLGVLGAALVAWVLKLTVVRGEPAMFVMEMPPVRLPSMTVVVREVWDRVVLFVKSAGTVILACSIVLWFLASYPKQDHGPAAAPAVSATITAPAGLEGTSAPNTTVETAANKVEHSYAGRIGKAMAPLIEPLGFDWQMGVAILASFAAREVFVASLATIYNLAEEEDSSGSLTEHLRARNLDGSFSTASALSLLVFYVFACQCMSTLAVCKRETGSWRWTALMFAYMTVLAYTASFVTYRTASHFLGASNPVASTPPAGSEAAVVG